MPDQPLTSNPAAPDEVSRRLKINNELFGSHGVIGRWAYFKNSLLIFFIAVVPLSLAAALAAATENLIVRGFAATVGISIVGFMLYMSFGLLVRRIKDIRRSPDDALGLTLLVLFLQFVPYVGFVVGAVVSFWPGEVAARAHQRTLIGSDTDDYETPPGV